MVCYYPLQGWKSRYKNKNGKYPVVFNVRDGWADKPIKVPCGQCIGCRLDRTKQWATRCLHESSLHDENCFITLTYNDENIPPDKGLCLRDFQTFMKRLRKEIYPRKIRFFHCGEYGDKLGRPHYHALIFGLDFYDLTCYTCSGRQIKSSALLQKLWPFGFNSVGPITYETASYVARYITKKITGEKATEHYMSVDEETGEILGQKKPEYVTMSRRPGIGAAWIKKYFSDVYPSDTVIVNGKEAKPPKFYDSQYEIIDEKELKKVKARRQNISDKVKQDNENLNRLRVKEQVAKAKMQFKKRSYEQ